MRLLKVVPIAKGIFSEDLAYFTTKDVKAGALVTVPVRNKTVHALVMLAEDVKNAKSAIRRSPFRLKKIKAVKAASFLHPEFIKTAQSLGYYFVSPLGLTLKSLIPQKFLEFAPEISAGKILKKEKSGYRETLFLETPLEERIKYYKSLIREKFAENSSVFLCLPTSADIDNFSEELKKGIEKYTVVMKTKMTKNASNEALEKILNENHPILIIGMPVFLFLYRPDLETVIVDMESSRHYKMRTRPYLDFRKAAEELCKNLKMRLIYGDDIARIETRYRKETGTISPIIADSSRVFSDAKQIISDMRGEKSKIIGREMETIIRQAAENNEHVILFINRRGYNPTTLCADCGSIITCSRCETPLVLHQSVTNELNLPRQNGPIQRRFLCHKCFAATVVSERCPNCGSWNLKSFGLGIQSLAEEINRLFSDAKIFRLDSDAVKTTKQGDAVIEKWQKTSGGILLATELLFSHLNRQTEHIAVVSIDNLFTIPDFRINERIFRLLLNLRKFANKTFLIQTHLANWNLFENLIKGNISEFYQSEIQSRKKFNYPPYKTLIKITIERKNRPQLENDIRNLTTQLKEFNPFSFPAFVSKIKNIYSWHILVKLDPETWPEKQEKLHKVLISLPPVWKINVNPETLL